MATGKGEEPVAAVPEKEEESGRMITLKSNDDLSFEVPEASARMSNTIGHLIDDGSADPHIPLPNVDSKTLKKVIEYCDEHGNKSGTDEEKERLKKWDETFIGKLDKDKDSLFEVVMAANYLNIQELLDLTVQSVADTIKGKCPQEIREAFNIEDDLTEQDREEILQENARIYSVRKP